MRYRSLRQSGTLKTPWWLRFPLSLRRMCHQPRSPRWSSLPDAASLGCCATQAWCWSASDQADRAIRESAPPRVGRERVVPPKESIARVLRARRMAVRARTRSGDVLRSPIALTWAGALASIQTLGKRLSESESSSTCWASLCCYAGYHSPVVRSARRIECAVAAAFDITKGRRHLEKLSVAVERAGGRHRPRPHRMQLVKTLRHIRHFAYQ